jgi:glutathione S-transferase
MHSAAFITLLNVLVLFMAMGLVGRARGKYGIKAPACSGHEQFECAYRAHMNTVEQTVMFLPVLWIASLYSNVMWAHWLGAAWIVGRIWYVLGYNKAPGARSGGFLLGFVSFIGLFVLSVIGLYQQMH